MHTKMLGYSKALNKFYCDNKAFWQVDFDWNGFQWIDCNDNENSIVSFIRKAEDGNDFIIAICNFTPEVHHGYRIGVPSKGAYVEVFNSDLQEFGGSGVRNEGDITTEDVPWHNREQSIVLTIPPLATVYLRRKGTEGAGEPEQSAPRTLKEKEEAVKESKPKTAKAKTTKPAAKKSSAKTAKKAAEDKPANKKKTASTKKKTADVSEAGDAPKKQTRAKAEEKKTEPKTKTKRASKAETEEKPKKRTARKKAAPEE